jgi:hypothetical protein
MKKIMCLILCSFVIKVSAQETIQFPTAKFSKGDHPEWKNANFDDGKWTSIKTNVIWEFQGYADYNGVAWYRFHFYLPSSLKNKSFGKIHYESILQRSMMLVPPILMVRRSAKPVVCLKIKMGIKRHGMLTVNFMWQQIIPHCIGMAIMC